MMVVGVARGCGCVTHPRARPTKRTLLRKTTTITGAASWESEAARFLFGIVMVFVSSTSRKANISLLALLNDSCPRKKPTPLQAPQAPHAPLAPNLTPLPPHSHSTDQQNMMQPSFLPSVFVHQKVKTNCQLCESNTRSSHCINRKQVASIQVRRVTPAPSWLAFGECGHSPGRCLQFGKVCVQYIQHHYGEKRNAVVFRDSVRILGAESWQLE